MQQLLEMDFAILDAIHTHLQSPLLDRLAVFLGWIGEMGIVWLLFAVILIVRKKHRFCGVTMIVGLIIGVIAGEGILKNIFCRPRPYQLRPDIVLLVRQPIGYSFPSGHTVSSFVSATVIGLYDRRWGIGAFLLATLIGLSRLYLYVHFPTDVLTGCLLGVLIGALSWFLCKKIRVERIREKK